MPKTVNSEFATDTRKGYAGSVSPQPLYDDGVGRLYCEYVYRISTGESDLFWFMWYVNGKSTTRNMSGVFRLEHLQAALDHILLGLKESAER